MGKLEYYEVQMCSYQPDGFVVLAEGMDKAVMKVMEHVKKKHPGLLGENGLPKEDGYPLIMRIGDKEWN